MGRIMNLSLTAVLSAVLALTGACANISNDSTRTQVEAILLCEGIGIGGGVLLGTAIKGREGAIAGAKIGAVLGLACGLIYGTSVAKKKEKYASEEAWLAACLEETEKTNQSLADYNSRLKTKLADYKKVAGSTPGASDKQAAINHDLETSQKVLASLDDEISSQRQVVSSAGKNDQTRQLEKQIKEMEKQKKLLEQQNRELAAISNRIAM